jgi:CubicO group peptidase (beta-lactamase class C family)
MKRLYCSLATLLMLGLATTARAYDFAPVSDPQALGFSPSRLERIAAWQQTQVDAGAFSGAVTVIARNGRVAYLRAVGFRDHAKTVPLQSDAIFWIASMSKPVTSVAAMMLVEEDKLDLAAPVHQYLPELKDLMVAVETKDPETGKTDLAREPQKRSITVEDLLRHTAGLVFGIGGTKADQLLYKSLYGPTGVYRRDKTLADFVSALAKLPLAHQPGEVWDSAPPSMCSRVSSRWPPVNSSSNSFRHACSSRSAWSTPAFTCPKPSFPVWLIRPPSAGRRTA